MKGARVGLLARVQPHVHAQALGAAERLVAAGARHPAGRQAADTAAARGSDTTRGQGVQDPGITIVAFT